MTQLVLEVHSFLEKIIELLIQSVKSFSKGFAGFLVSLAEARQMQANHKVAEQLWLTEYRNRSFYEVLDAVNSGNLERLRDGR